MNCADCKYFVHSKNGQVPVGHCSYHGDRVLAQDVPCEAWITKTTLGLRVDDLVAYEGELLKVRRVTPALTRPGGYHVHMLPLGWKEAEGEGAWPYEWNYIKSQLRHRAFEWQVADVELPVVSMPSPSEGLAFVWELEVGDRILHDGVEREITGLKGWTPGAMDDRKACIIVTLKDLDRYVWLETNALVSIVTRQLVFSLPALAECPKAE